MTETKTRPAYREPWTHGAKGYAEADTLEALAEGMKRKRKLQTVHLNNETLGHIPCACCGIPVGDPYPVNAGDTTLRTDKWATGKYIPRTKGLIAMHYYCSWGSLMADIFQLGRTLRLG
jgi:hypothetical protein